MNPAIFNGLLDILKSEPVSGRTLLDASCGDGISSRTYREMGYDVTPTNFDLPDMTCVKVDLNYPWPFGDGEFDVVVLQEVIEHLENVPLAFREGQRVLKPGGILVFTTPNMLSWTSRLQFFLTGFYRGYKKPMRLREPPAEGPNWHILPFHIYHWLCHHYGLKIERVLGINRRRGVFLLGLLLYPVSALYTRLWWVWSEKDERQRAFNQEVWSHLYSRQMLFSRNIAVRIRKPH
jgi:SAM-dependent methyltransferase